MKFIDSHCHLPSSRKQEKLEGILERAKSEGVVKFVNIGTSIKENEKVLQTARLYEEIFPTAAIYPHKDLDKDFSEIKNYMESFVEDNFNLLVGIGEAGIDITDWRRGRSVEQQYDLFRFQARLAKKFKLPLIIHNRNGDNEVLKVLTEIRPPKGIIHCFSSEWDFAEKVLDLGFCISFSGFITYKSRKGLLETVKKVPKDRFLIETDSPYLLPEGCSGERNEPKCVKIVAQKVADTKGITLEEVADLSLSTAEKLFEF